MSQNIANQSTVSTFSMFFWIATDKKDDFDDIMSDSLYENATVSKPSQDLIVDIMKKLDLDELMKFGKNSLDENRHTLHKISTLLDTEVQQIGMFYTSEADDKMIDLFDRSGVQYIRLSLDDKKLIRLNIGQTNEILTKAIKAIEKTNRRK